MEQLSRDNHYVPQMYLGNWSTSKQIWMYYLLVSHEKVPCWSKKAIDNIAFLTNLYTRFEKGKEIDDFEHDFCDRFESPAKAPLEKVINGQRLSADDWRCVSKFIAAQYVRTPAFHQFIRKRMPSIAEKAFSEAGKSLSEAKNYSLKIDNADSKHYDASLMPIDVNITDEKDDENNTYVEICTIVGKSYWLWTIKHFLEPNSVVLQAFCNMKWSIVSCPAGCSFPITDNPVAVFCEDSNGNYIKTSGIAYGNNMVLFPLSPQKALIGKQKNRLDYRINADEEMYQKLKRVIVDYAFLYVFSDHEDLDIPKMRERTVDETLYKQINTDFENWYSSYIEQEVPIIRKWEDKK